MEIVIACLIATYVVKNGVIDAAYAVRGKPSPRRSLAHELVRARAANTARRTAADRPPSAFGRYVAQLWEDSWDEARVRHDRRLQKRRDRRADRDAGVRPSGALHRYVAAVRTDLWAKWDRTWDDASNKRHDRRTAGQAQALAAALIAASEATNVNTSDHAESRTREQAGQHAEPTTAGAVDDEESPASQSDREGCRWRIRSDTRGNEWCGRPATHRWHDRATGRRLDALCAGHAVKLAEMLTFESQPVDPPTAITHTGTDSTGSPDSTGDAAGETASAPALATVHPLNGSTQEASEVTATTSGETSTLSQTLGAINSWEAATQEAITSLETSIASLQGSEVGPTVTQPLGKAQEAFAHAQAAFVEARDALQPSTQIGDMYHSNPDAGDREFVTG